MATRLRRVGTKSEMESLLDDYITQGYAIVEQGERTVMVRKKTWGTTGGHVLWAFLTAWWTLGLGNLTYALIAHYGAEQILLKLDTAKG